jgi:anti-sigma factor RsiW
MNFSSPHLKFDRLADLAEGRIPAGERERLLAHVSVCPRCKENLSHIESTIKIMRTDTMEDAPSHVIERANKIFRPRAKPPATVFKRVLAALKFDSLLESRASGLRAAATFERQILFGAGEYDLHLQIKQAEDQWAISGQVLGPCAGGEVELVGDAQNAEAQTLSASLTEMCEFTLDSVPGGIYLMTIKMADAELKIPELKLGS